MARHLRTGRLKQPSNTKFGTVTSTGLSEPDGTVAVVNPRKLLRRVAGGSRSNVAFDDMRRLVEAFGFELSRVSGSHHIFIHPDVPEIVNLQEVGGEAKPYQIRQFLRLVERYALTLEERA